MGCGCRRDEGQGKKTEVARGGWAEDARRPPATSFIFVVIPASQGHRQRAFAASEPSSPWAGWAVEGSDVFRAKRIDNRFHSHDRVSRLGLKL